MAKRVKQISVDILVDEHADGCVLAEIVSRDLEEAGNVVLGSSFIADLTETYEKDYLELLEGKSYEKLRGFCEQVCWRIRNNWI